MTTGLLEFRPSVQEHGWAFRSNPATGTRERPERRTTKGCNVQMEIRTAHAAWRVEAQRLGWCATTFAARNRRLDESAADNQRANFEGEAA